MRHAGEIGEDRLAADILAERQAQVLAGLLEGLRTEQLAQEDGLALGIGKLDADDIAAGHDGDADRHGAHRAGDVVGEADDAGRFDAGGRLELVQGHDRAGADMDDLAADAEILEHAFEHAGILLEHLVGEIGGAALVAGLGQQGQGRQLELAARPGAAAGSGFDRTGGLGDPLARDGRQVLLLVLSFICRFVVVAAVAVLVVQSFGVVGKVVVGIVRVGFLLAVVIDRAFGAPAGVDQPRLDPHHLGSLALRRGFGLGSRGSGGSSGSGSGTRRLAAALALKQAAQQRAGALDDAGEETEDRRDHGLDPLAEQAGPGDHVVAANAERAAGQDGEGAGGQHRGGAAGDAVMHGEAEQPDAHIVQDIADAAAKAGAEHPARRHRQAREKGRGGGAGKRPGNEPAQRPAERGMAEQGEGPAERDDGQGNGAEAEALHELVGEGGAGPAEQILRRRIDGVVERGIIGPPARQADCGQPGGADQGEAAQLEHAVAEEAPQAFGNRTVAGFE